MPRCSKNCRSNSYLETRLVAQGWRTKALDTCIACGDPASPNHYLHIEASNCLWSWDWMVGLSGIAGGRTSGMKTVNDMKVHFALVQQQMWGSPLGETVALLLNDSMIPESSLALFSIDYLIQQVRCNLADLQP